MRHGLHILMLGLALLAWTPRVCAQETAADTREATPANTDMSIDARSAVQRARRLAQQLPDEVAPSADTAESKPLGVVPASPDNIENRPLGVQSSDDRVADGGGVFSGGHGWVLNTLTALGLVIGLVLLLRFGVTRFGRRAATTTSRVVEVMSRTSVAPRNHILLIRVGGRVLVVGDSTQGLRTLTEIDEPEEVASLLQSVEADREASLTNGFNKMLARYTGVYSERGLIEDQGGDDGEIRVDRTRDSVSSLLGRVRAMAGRGAGE